MPYRKRYGKYTYSGYEKKNRRRDNTSFRVKSPIRSFRDLEVYQKTNLLSARIHHLASGLRHPRPRGLILADDRTSRQSAPPELTDELNILREDSRRIPVWIAESYNDKFTDFARASAKLEGAVETISVMISRLDFITACLDPERDREPRREVQEVTALYQRQKLKILNLNKAWARVFAKNK